MMIFTSNIRRHSLHNFHHNMLHTYATKHIYCVKDYGIIPTKLYREIKTQLKSILKWDTQLGSNSDNFKYLPVAESIKPQAEALVCMLQAFEIP